jgi:hypothetical protein
LSAHGDTPVPADDRARADAYTANALSRRALVAAAWLAGLLVFAFLAWALVRNGEEGNAFGVGYAVGTVLAALGGGVLASWLLAKARRRGRVLSPWILVVAIAILAYRVATTVPAVAAPSSVPVATYVKVEAPYEIGLAPADVVRQFDAQFGRRAVGDTHFASIEEAGEIVGYLIVGDFGLVASDRFLEGFEAGFEETAGNVAQIAVLHGRDILMGSGQVGGVAVWEERPFGLIVYAADKESAQVLAESVIEAYTVP